MQEHLRIESQPNHSGRKSSTAVVCAAPGRATLAQLAKATLRHIRFAEGIHCGTLELSPVLRKSQVVNLTFWIERLDAALQQRLPRLKVAAAERLCSTSRAVFINEPPPFKAVHAREQTHAVSFIPERYVVLEAALFRPRIELGRILYHELCHFVWPYLGNPARRRYQAVIEQELREGVRGELGYSAECRKTGLAHTKRAKIMLRSAREREYLCESFCDTGSFVLLGSERQRRHSEYTLSARARQRRCRVWLELVLGG